MNRGALKIGFTSLLLLLFVFCLVSPTTAQGEIGRSGGKISIKTDIEMMSGVPVHGGGHVTWVVTGGAARDLRAAILTHYDIAHGQSPPNGQLDIDEVDRYAKDVERYLENEGLRYQGANMRRFSLLNYDVEDDTKGLIRTSNASTENIELRYYFDAWMPSGNEEVQLSDTEVSDAILAPLNETLVKDGEYEIEHTEYMVSVGDFSNINIEEGTFYLIRTPFGDIYYYKVTFEAGENPRDEVLYEPFNWIESPLVLFIMVAILGYFTATMPSRFRRYDVMRIAKIHTLAKILVVILFLMYFFAGFGGIFIAGMYLWILSFVFMFVSLVISRTVYENAKRIPQTPKAEEPAAAAPVEEPEEPEPEEPRRRNVQCRTCGDIFHLEAWDTPASAVCPSCGGMGAIPLGDTGEEPVPQAPRPKPPPPRPPRA